MQTNETYPVFGLRMPDAMRDHIKVLADRDRRSLNSEIICLLEKAIEGIEPQRNDGASKFPDLSPAVAENNAALQGSVTSTPALEMPK